MFFIEWGPRVFSFCFCFIFFSSSNSSARSFWLNPHLIAYTVHTPRPLGGPLRPCVSPPISYFTTTTSLELDSFRHFATATTITTTTPRRPQSTETLLLLLLPVINQQLNRIVKKLWIISSLSLSAEPRFSIIIIIVIGLVARERETSKEFFPPQKISAWQQKKMSRSRDLSRAVQLLLLLFWPICSSF